MNTSHTQGNAMIENLTVQEKKELLARLKADLKVKAGRPRKDFPLFDAILQESGLATDTDLSKELGLPRSYIGHMRTRRRAVSAGVIIMIQRRFGLTINRIDELLAA